MNCVRRGKNYCTHSCSHKNLTKYIEMFDERRESGAREKWCRGGRIVYERSGGGERGWCMREVVVEREDGV